MSPSPPKPWESGPAAVMHPSHGTDSTVHVDAGSADEAAVPPPRPTDPLPIVAASPQPLPSTPYAVGGPAYSGHPGYGYAGYGPSAALGPYSAYGHPHSAHYSPYSSASAAPSTYGGYGGYGGYGSGTAGGYGLNGPAGHPALPQAYHSTFQTIEQIVHAIGGLAHMLESTYMATHSSLMAMLGVAEHFGNLRRYCVDALGVLAVWQSLRSLLPQTGSPISASAATAHQLVKEFESGATISSTAAVTRPAFQRHRVSSRQPMLLFLAMAIGIPWLIRHLIHRMQQQQQRQQHPSFASSTVSSAPVTVEFARALYDFQAQSVHEISFRRGDFIAVLSQCQDQVPAGTSSPWWQGKKQHGPIGYFPASHVCLLGRSVELPAESSLSPGSSHPKAGLGMPLLPAGKDSGFLDGPVQ